MNISDSNPDARSWRKAYGLALSLFAVEVVLLYLFTSGFREPAGLPRSHRHDSGDPALWSLANARKRLFRSISQGRCEYSVGHDWTVGPRDPGRADHLSFHAGPGV